MGGRGSSSDKWWYDGAASEAVVTRWGQQWVCSVRGLESLGRRDHARTWVLEAVGCTHGVEVVAWVLMVLSVYGFGVPLLQQMLPGMEMALKCKAHCVEEMRQKALKLRHTVRTPSEHPFFSCRSWGARATDSKGSNTCEGNCEAEKAGECV